ncbi:MAG: alpha-glucosidase C-terminal domain-containing protein [Rhodocyclaceae bacterium]|nr:alpha-glucosidase C-terminal domain-containing protein [Rhodocyclaceae bacterium]
MPVELLGRTAFPPIGELPYLLTLKGYGYYGFRLATDVEVPYWHEERLARRELPVLVIDRGLADLLGRQGRRRHGQARHGDTHARPAATRGAGALSHQQALGSPSRAATSSASTSSSRASGTARTAAG